MATARELYVSRWGDVGERLVLIHGSNTADPDEIWDAQRDLAAQYQVIIPHRRGYGRSPVRNPGWTYEAELADLLPLLGEGAHVVGLSYGGLLAMLLAGQHPDRVHSLTVIEPPVFRLVKDDPQVAQLIAALTPVYAASPTPEVFIAGFVQAFGEQLPADFQLSPQHRKGVETTMYEPAPWTIPLPFDALAQLPLPKLAVSGDWLPAFITTIDRLAQRIAAERLLIAGAGHGAQGSGKPFNERLLALMQSA